MNKKSWLKYLAGIILIIIVLGIKGYIEKKLNNELRTTFQMNYFLLTVVVILNAAIGIIIGLEHFLREVKTIGKWKVNLPKTILLLIPSLLLAFFYFVPLIKNESIVAILYWPYVYIFQGSTSFINVFQIVLGYCLITIFYKEAFTEKTIEEKNWSGDEHDSTEEITPENDNSSDKEIIIEDETIYMRPVNKISEQGFDNDDIVNRDPSEELSYKDKE